MGKRKVKGKEIRREVLRDWNEMGLEMDMMDRGGGGSGRREGGRNRERE